MVPLLSEAWKCIQYLLRAEGQGLGHTGGEPVWATTAARLLAACKPLFWYGVAVLAGLGLSRLGG